MCGGKQAAIRIKLLRKKEQRKKVRVTGERGVESDHRSQKNTERPEGEKFTKYRLKTEQKQINWDTKHQRNLAVNDKKEKKK